MNNDKSILIIFSFLLLIVFLIVSSLPFFSILGIVLFIYFSLNFYFNIGKTIEIRDLIIVLAFLQWIIGPVLKYNLFPEDIFYYMAVSETEYMSFAVPATIALSAGLFFPVFYKRLDSTHHIKKIEKLLYYYPNIDLILIGAGLILNVLKDFFPENIRFFIYLLSLMRYTGLLFMTINKQRQHKWLIFLFVILVLFAEAIKYGIFHELILWLTLLFIIVAFLYQFKNKQKLAILIPLITFIVIIQSVKFFYRQDVQQLSNTYDKVEIFSELVKNELLGQGYMTSENNIEAAVDRINQGWIVARIMKHIPRYEPFANGETIITGIRASLIPRFLDPDKPTAGGRNYFTRFTGKIISDNTSMGLSPLGEAYANFGVNGGIVFMFLLGLFYNFFIFLLLNLANKHPSIILWIPLLFLQVIKAETDFVVVLNHLIKASIVVSMIIWAFKKFFNIKL